MFTCIYVLLYEGKCKWSYGPSCPVDFPLNIFIHSFIHSSEYSYGWRRRRTNNLRRTSLCSAYIGCQHVACCGTVLPLQWIGISCWPGAQQKTRRTLLRRLIAGVLRQITRPCPSINYYTMRRRLTCNALMLSGGRGYRPGRRRRRYSTFAPSPDTCPRN